MIVSNSFANKATGLLYENDWDIVVKEIGTNFYFRCNKSRAKLKLIKKANTLTTTLYKKADDFSLISKNLLTRDNNFLHLIKTRTSFVLTAPKRTKLTIIKTKQLNF